MYIFYSGSALIKCGQFHQKLGLAHKEYVQSAAGGFMQPLKSFLDGEMKSLTVNISLSKVNHIILLTITIKSRKNAVL